MQNAILIRIIAFVFSFFILHSSFIIPVHAAEFATSYDVHFIVSEDGNTHVVSTIGLTNLVTNLYATEYAVTIKNSHIQNVSGTDSKGPLSIRFDQKKDESRITAEFNDRVVGKGKTLTFQLAYDSAEIAKKTGRIWEITLPKVSDDESTSKYTIKLSVPESFGSPLYFKPEPTAFTSGSFSWNYEQLKKGIVSAAFGSNQVFSFRLRYHLSNNQNTPSHEEIALPPDTPYQKVVFKSLDPMPISVKRDENDNWLASYTLEPESKIDVLANGTVELSIKPRPDYPFPKSSQKFDTFLKSATFWQVNNPDIQALAQKLGTAESIYSYVVSKLSYDFTKVTSNPVRLGAKESLARPTNAICMEFTDLTVALMRAAGIPAREINGYAYTTNTELRPLSLVADVLHAWPEYYDKDKNTWIPIDPTWANTTGGTDYFSTFDLNHIVFAIHGISSEYPYPAGAYKRANNGKVELSKDIDIAVESELPREELHALTSQVLFPSALSVGENAQVTITNPNKQAMYTVPVRLKGDGVEVIPSSILIDALPPFGSISYPIHIKANQFWPVGSKKITVEFMGNKHVTAFSAGYGVYIFSSVSILSVLSIILLFHSVIKKTKKHHGRPS